MTTSLSPCQCTFRENIRSRRGHPLSPGLDEIYHGVYKTRTLPTSLTWWLCKITMKTSMLQHQGSSST
ncbi:hypothetical protein CesoFtcFv8_024555 [Champsocephalus esox]|uniref:Uncharacterized protein n=1 Tax=Champsocephalus esox TaxID=159716 RepID=A0AAN8GF45_9TELE|nr:hypothetical protein CesoFtcFv8_024555 [Champsocephalus esox]